MPSSEFGSSPSSAMRRAISRALRPASTNTRVPLATSNTALPVDPLPSTESFIGVSDFQPRTVDSKAIEVTERAQRELRRGKAILGHAQRVFARRRVNPLNDFVGRNSATMDNFLTGERSSARA